MHYLKKNKFGVFLKALLIGGIYCFFFLILIAIFFYWLNTKYQLKPLWAQDSYQVNVGSTVTINKWGVCKRVTNNCSYSIFVPVKTSNEWTAFVNYKPSCVTLNNCGWVCSGSGSVKYYGCEYERVYNNQTSCGGTLLGYRCQSCSTNINQYCSSTGSGNCYMLYGNSISHKIGRARYNVGSCITQGCFIPSQRYNYSLLPSVVQCTFQ
ncbi:MAG: hypothetical protein ACPLYC_00330 [Minisyncoccia bacterium]